MSAKEIDDCGDCWRSIEEKLQGKGRPKRKQGMVFLPPQAAPEQEPGEPKRPLGPPKIFGVG
jgi:hypothetical protein